MPALQTSTDWCYLSFKIKHLFQIFCCQSVRLREFELEVDNSTKRGPYVERVYFVIIEMAREFS